MRRVAGRITAPRMNASPCLSTVRPPLALAAEDERISSLDPLHADAHLCRMPHKKLAEEAYAHSGAENRTHGSGGYSTDILSQILHLMNKQAETLNAF